MHFTNMFLDNPVSLEEIIADFFKKNQLLKNINADQRYFNDQMSLFKDNFFITNRLE